MASRTHEVFNQPGPLVGINLLSADRTLIETLEREGASPWMQQLSTLGSTLGQDEWIRRGFLANSNPPLLETHDRFGRRRDEVEFHPAWHDLLRLAVQNGLHSMPWSDPRPGAHVARAALMLLAGQNEAGHLCPLSMTYSSVPVLRLSAVSSETWLPALLSREYDPRFRPHTGKTGVLIGMGMTEKQGGSDVRANTTRAEPDQGPWYRITGHKWFCSAPMSDAFVVLAQAAAGLTCFFLPRWDPAGGRNSFEIQRLKNKLGNRSNASCEVEFRGAVALRIGDEGRGVSTIMEMVQHTRLDCCLGSAAIMRRALLEALHHARQRCAFGRLLSEHPLMQSVLADLAVESEAATLLSMRLARAFDRRARDPRERAFSPPRNRGREILDLQTGSIADRRGAGVPRRRRLRGRVHSPSSVSRGAAQLHLGGVRKRDVPRRSAGCSQGTGVRFGRPGRDPSGSRKQRPF